jgi:hypothetical protein
MKRMLAASMLLPATIIVASGLAQAPSQPEAQKPTPWPVMLGMRVAGVQEKIPLQDRVVLVPDEATFIDEIGKWTLQGRWPVLIEDDIFAPLFIRAFAPRQVIRRTERAPALNDDAAINTAIAAAVTRAWGGDPGTQSPKQARLVQSVRLAPYQPQETARSRLRPYRLRRI